MQCPAQSQLQLHYQSLQELHVFTHLIHMYWHPQVVVRWQESNVPQGGLSPGVHGLRVSCVMDSPGNADSTT